MTSWTKARRRAMTEPTCLEARASAKKKNQIGDMLIFCSIFFLAEEAQAMIIANEQDRVTVKSFTQDGTQYEVAVADGEMTSCTCPDHAQSKAACKHMYLVNKVQLLLLPQPDDAMPMPDVVQESRARNTRQIDPD